MTERTELNLRRAYQRDIDVLELTIARLRAANKKLRKELERARVDEENSRELASCMEEQASVWQIAHRQLAEAIGGKAK